MEKPLIERLHAMASATTHVSHGISTTTARTFTYEESLEAMKLCREAARTLELVRDIMLRSTR